MSCRWSWWAIFVGVFWVQTHLLPSPARAAERQVQAAVVQLASGDALQIQAGIEALALEGSDVAIALLTALQDKRLSVDDQGALFLEQKGEDPVPALEGGPVSPSGSLRSVRPNNSARRMLEVQLARLRLSSPELGVRREAAAALLDARPSEEVTALLRQRLEEESDADVLEMLRAGIARADLDSPDPGRQLAAIEAVRASGDVTVKDALGRLAESDDEEIRTAATSALARVEWRLFGFGLVANTIYGLSLASVLLLAALGLAITFGLMGVINMAHGEMLMIGAYSAYTVQNVLADHAPSLVGWSVILAIPVAFVASGGVGLVLERTVIRRLYGRPLETLLATWGLSLILIQVVRTTYGAQNVAVEVPQWLSGGWELVPMVVVPYTRLAVLAFTAIVVAFVWVVLQKTSLGLRVRAVTQNRTMAAAIGISTRQVDMWTFALGSGVAGLGGVALSQLGNVGPELGQQHIIDSFMVVVLGGVGSLFGTVAGAATLGIANKFLEPTAGAVLGKILILGLLILFIQWRPSGLFALKGRAAEN